jgi:DNA-binding MarR family transcriptional regulator
MLELVDLPNEKVLKEIAARYPDIQVDPAAIASILVFMKLGSEILRRAETHFQKRKLSGGRVSVLMLLMRDRIQGLTPSNLAERAGVTRATMTGLIDGLEKDGYVRRKVDSDDKRRQSVELTPKGIRLIDKLYPDHMVRMTNLMSVLNAEEKKILAQLVLKLRRKLCEMESKA